MRPLPALEPIAAIVMRLGFLADRPGRGIGTLAAAACRQ